MEMAALLDVLIQNGGLGLFAGYLIYEASRSRAQIHSLTEVIGGQSSDFGKQLEKLREENRHKEDNLRDRYDEVISGLNSKEAEHRSELTQQIILLAQKVDRYSSDLDIINTSIKALETRLGALDASVSELKMREIARGSKSK